MKIRIKFLVVWLTMAVCLHLVLPASWGQGIQKKWASDVRIRFFTGGAEGVGFGSIVYSGAVHAAEGTGTSSDHRLGNECKPRYTPYP